MHSAEMVNFVLFRGSKRVTLKEDDMTTEKISRIFQVHGPSLYITDDNFEALFPGTDGSFSFLDLTIGGHYEVHGETISVEESPSAPVRRNPPRLALHCPGSASATAAIPKATMAIVFQRSVHIADIVEGKLETNKTLTVCFTEFEACVPVIVSKVKNALGRDDTFILTDGNGNQILDSEGTRGSKYWKKKSRKVFAVPETGFMLLRGSKRTRQSGLHLVVDQIEEVVLAAQRLQEVSTSMKKLIAFVHSSNRRTVSLTEAQAAAVRDAFACVVCKCPVDEPMVSSCCQSLIGCRMCVEEWQRHSTFCPKCRAGDVGGNIQRLTGLSDALAALKNIFLE